MKGMESLPPGGHKHKHLTGPTMPPTKTNIEGRTSFMLVATVHRRSNAVIRKAFSACNFNHVIVPWMYFKAKLLPRVIGVEPKHHCNGAYQVALLVKNHLPVQEMQDTWVQSLGREGPLEEGMADHSHILSWRIPWTEELGRLQSMGSHRVGHNWRDSVAVALV